MLIHKTDQTNFSAWEGPVPEKYQVHELTAQELLDTADEARGTPMWMRSPSSKDTSWSNGLNSETCLNFARKGDTSLVKASTLEPGKLNLNMSNAFKVINAFEGTPNVGRYLSGRADCFKARKRVQSARRVKVVLSTVCSASVTADQWLYRGAAVLGLLEALQTMQIQVDLYMLLEIGCLTLIEIPSRPLDLSTSGFMLGHPGFTRCVAYPWVDKQLSKQGHGTHFDWPPGRLNDFGRMRNEEEYQRKVRLSLGLEEHDILIESHCGGRGLPDPLSTVNAQLAKYQAKE